MTFNTSDLVEVKPNTFHNSKRLSSLEPVRGVVVREMPGGEYVIVELGTHQIRVKSEDLEHLGV